MSFLYDKSGRRKYLTIDERQAFLEAATDSQPEIHTFCATLAYTGARISEVLALTPGAIDFSDGVVVVECLKKRRQGIYRAIPLPHDLLSFLDHVHCIQRAQQQSIARQQRIWQWCRTTAWQYVKTTMTAAGVKGSHATPKGLRHGFGVSAIQEQVPLNLVRKWLGHSRLATTAIYTDALGKEEREIAKHLWRTFR